jgi:Ca2+-dependent lipid-binding protein
LRLREKELKIRHRAAIEAQQLPLGKEGSKNTNNAAAMATPAAKLRKEVRALLVLGCADGREAEGPNGKAVKAKLKEAKKAADVARKAKDKKRKEKVKAAKAKKKADRKAKAAAYKAAVAKAKKANKPLPEPEDHDSDSDDDGLAKEPTELQPNDEKFRWATPFTLEGPPPLPPLTEEDVDNATEQFLEDRLRKEVGVVFFFFLFCFILCKALDWLYTLFFFARSLPQCI